MSFKKPSYVSATTGYVYQKSSSLYQCLSTNHFSTASLTIPTLFVLVIMMGVSKNPDSVTQVVPVISPFPFNEYQLAYTGLFFKPLGRMAVTPVLTGPLPRMFLPCPEMMVLYPTSMPFTSVMALNFPGVPLKGMPISLALGFCA